MRRAGEGQRTVRRLRRPRPDAGRCMKSFFRCSEGCDFRASLTDVVYRCGRCGGLLEVAHDLDALKQRSASEWKALFKERFADPQLSGIWGKREWVYPELEDSDIVSLGEGRVPLLPLPKMAARLG